MRRSGAVSACVPPALKSAGVIARSPPISHCSRMRTARHSQNQSTWLKQNRATWLVPALVLMILGGSMLCVAAANGMGTNEAPFPPPLASYGDGQLPGLWDVLRNRVHKEPFNLWATIIFLCAIIHTFLTHKFVHWSRLVEKH